MSAVHSHNTSLRTLLHNLPNSLFHCREKKAVRKYVLQDHAKNKLCAFSLYKFMHSFFITSIRLFLWAYFSINWCNQVLDCIFSTSKLKFCQKPLCTSWSYYQLQPLMVWLKSNWNRHFEIFWTKYRRYYKCFLLLRKHRFWKFNNLQ